MAAKNGRETLETLSKDDLVARAEALGIDGARKFTKVELIDEIGRAAGSADRGLLGLARELLRNVVDKGLGQARKSAPPTPIVAMPVASRPAPAAAAEVEVVAEARPAPPSEPPKPALHLDATPEPPVPTVTLAEIYAGQGHVVRARAILREVLRVHPGDASAVALLERLEAGEAPAPRVAKVEPGALPDDPYARVGIEREAFVEPPAEHAPEVPSMLDDAPFPARYDVDECVAMAVDPTTVYVYWETRRVTVGRARRALARSEQGNATSVLRVLVVEPHERGPRVSTRDFEVLDLELGEWFVRDLPAGSIVRAAIGLLLGERFLPLAHTLDVEAPTDRPSQAVAHEIVEWTEGGTRAPSAPGPRLPAIGQLAAATRNLGLPPMPELPGDDASARGLSSAELARRARIGRARSAGERPGPTSTSWVNR